MRELTKELEQFIQLKATQAIIASETYQGAINLVRSHSSLSEAGQVVKKAIQDEIVKRALNSKIN